MKVIMQESTLRKLIVERLKSHYPDMGEMGDNWVSFLAGAKVPIDSWVGDVFAVVLREQSIAKDYEKWRARLFVD